MKNAACWCLAFSLLALHCKKENPVPDDPNLLHLTFTGTVANELTGAPVANVPVHLVYGTMCCGGLEVIKGSDSTTTNINGVYTIHLNYTKGSAAYRHLVYVPGYLAKRLNIPSALQRNTEWITLDYDDAASLPGDVADTVKIVDGYVSTANISVIPGAIVKLNFPYTSVPATDSIKITAATSLDGVVSNYTVNLNQPVHFNPNAVLNNYPFLIERPSLANREIIIETSVYQAGTGLLKATVLDSVTLVQGQLYNYEVEY